MSLSKKENDRRKDANRFLIIKKRESKLQVCPYASCARREPMELKEAIRKSTPPHHRNKTHARVFQAIRIAVNDEIDKLKSFLKIFLDYLEIGGRLVVISYHSIEDRIVKHSFRQLNNESKVELLTRKPLTPSTVEIKLNKRSRSAKMRALERVL